MDWGNGIQKSLDYIEEHLTENLSYEEIAREAACSNFYFQKIFCTLCGMPLGEYIRNRRLTLAGNELRSTSQKVIDVAFKYGYESPESFTRAFTKFHGVTPSEAKKTTTPLKSFSRLFVKLSLIGGNIMQHKIIEKEDFYILEKVESQSLINGENLKSIPAFWTRSQCDGSIDKLCALATDKDNVFGFCYGNPDKSATNFDYSIAVICDENTPVPNGFRKTHIPAKTWAVFECIGAMPTAIQELWSRIITEFFPVSEYQALGELDVEVYPDGDMGSANYRSEIWIAVAKK